jgi:hypothetical protein
VYYVQMKTAKQIVTRKVIKQWDNKKRNKRVNLNHWNRSRF